MPIVLTYTELLKRKNTVLGNVYFCLCLGTHVLTC